MTYQKLSDDETDQTNPSVDKHETNKRFVIFWRWSALKKYIHHFKRNVGVKKIKIPSWRQLFYSYKIFSRRERHLLVTCLAIITVSVIWLGVNQAGAYLKEEPKTGGTYTEALIGQPQFLNPIFASAQAVDMDLTKLLFSGLFRYDDQLNLVLDQAESYEVSEDGRIYTITLRDNLVWHDAEPLTIDDVMFTFESLTDPDIESPLGQSFRGTVIEKIDDQTVRFTLKEPYSAFLDTLTVGLIPEHIWGEIPVSQWRLADYNIRPIGNGSWQFSTLSKDKEGFIKAYALEKTKKTEPEGFIDYLIFRFYPDEASALSALNGRNVQGLALLSNIDKLSINKSYEYYDLRLPATTAIFFNLGQTSPINDLAVRKALKQAIDKRALVLKTLAGKASVSTGPLPNTILEKQQDDDSTSGNKKMAEEALEKEGWKKVGDIRKNKKGDILSITLTVIDREPDRSVGQFIQQAWKDIGVEVKIDLVFPATPTNIRRSVLRPRAYEALLYTIVYGAHPDPYPFWHSSQRVDPGLNFSLFNNEEADKAIENIRRALDEDSIQTAYENLHEIIIKQVPAIFLFSPIRNYVISNNVKGVTINNIATPSDRFNDINNWYTKTKTRFNW